MIFANIPLDGNPVWPLASKGFGPRILSVHAETWASNNTKFPLSISIACNSINTSKLTTFIHRYNNLVHRPGRRSGYFLLFDCLKGSVLDKHVFGHVVHLLSTHNYRFFLACLACALLYYNTLVYKTLCCVSAVA